MYTKVFRTYKLLNTVTFVTTFSQNTKNKPISPIKLKKKAIEFKWAWKKGYMNLV